MHRSLCFVIRNVGHTPEAAPPDPIGRRPLLPAAALSEGTKVSLVILLGKERNNNPEMMKEGQQGEATD